MRLNFDVGDEKVAGDGENDGDWNNAGDEDPTISEKTYVSFLKINRGKIVNMQSR